MTSRSSVHLTPIREYWSAVCVFIRKLKLLISWQWICVVGPWTRIWGRSWSKCIINLSTHLFLHVSKGVPFCIICYASIFHAALTNRLTREARNLPAKRPLILAENHELDIWTLNFIPLSLLDFCRPTFSQIVVSRVTTRRQTSCTGLLSETLTSSLGPGKDNYN